MAHSLKIIIYLILKKIYKQTENNGKWVLMFIAREVGLFFILFNC